MSLWAEVQAAEQAKRDSAHAQRMDALDRANVMSIYNQLIPQGQENFNTLAGLLGGQGPGGSSFMSNFTGVSGVEDRLKALLDDPESIRQTGAYKFRVGQGQEALQRSLGAKGLLASGNRLNALTEFGQDMASQEYENQFRRLSDLLGQGMQAKASMFGSLAGQTHGGLGSFSGNVTGGGGGTGAWNTYRSSFSGAGSGNKTGGGLAEYANTMNRQAPQGGLPMIRGW